MIEQIIIYLVALLLLLWLTIYFAYRFGSWRLRMKLMKKLAQQMNLKFVKKDEYKIHYLLSGSYLGKIISIEEYNTFLSPIIDVFEEKSATFYTPARLGFGTQRETTKKLIITVDDKKIYERNGDRLLPFTKKVKQIIDDYINKGKITKNIMSPILTITLLFGFCIILTIIFVLFVLN